MKKYISLGCILLLLALPFSGVAGCAPSHSAGPIPYGIWHSETPNLTVYIDPSVDGYYTAEYIVDGQTHDSIVSIDMRQSGSMLVQPRSALTDKGLYRDIEYVFFQGTIKEKNGQLIYSIDKIWSQKTGYKTIVFEKIGEYPAPSSSEILSA